MRIRKGGKFSAVIASEMNGKAAFRGQQTLEGEREEIGSSSRNAANDEKTRIANDFDLNMPPTDDEPPPTVDEPPLTDDEPLLTVDEPPPTDDAPPPTVDESPPRYSFRKRSRKRFMFKSRADGESWDHSESSSSEDDPMETTIPNGEAEELTKEKCADRNEHVPDDPPLAEDAPEKAGGATTSVKANAPKKRAESAPEKASGATSSARASAQKKTPVKDDEYWYYCADELNNEKGIEGEDQGEGSNKGEGVTEENIAVGAHIPVIYIVSSDSD